MKKGMAIEGFILEDKTVRPVETYDDTELREKIQINADNIDNIDSRVTALETHGGGVEDPTKADKVTDAVEGNLAGLDEEGNLTDSGYKPSDFAPAAHNHDKIIQITDNYISHVHCNGDEIEIFMEDMTGEEPVEKTVALTVSNMANLERSLATPDATPTDGSDKLITSDAVYDALAGKAASVHSHDEIRKESGTSIASVETATNDQVGGQIIFKAAYGSNVQMATITADLIPNLVRALNTPSSTPETGTVGENKLITSKAVYTALSKKAEAPKTIVLNKRGGYYYLYDSNGTNTDTDNINSIRSFMASTKNQPLPCRVMFHNYIPDATDEIGDFYGFATIEVTGVGSPATQWIYTVRICIGSSVLGFEIGPTGVTAPENLWNSDFPEKYNVTTITI